MSFRSFGSVLRKFLLVSFLLILGTAVYAQPVITSFSPASGPTGTTVTITGSGFSTAPSANIVFFGAVRATVLGAASNSLSVQVPAGATYQPITVTSNTLTGYSARPFIVTFPGGNDLVAPSSQEQTSFELPVDSTMDPVPSEMALADFDGDGKIDIATTNNLTSLSRPSVVSILRNTGSTRNISFAPRMDIPRGTYTNAIAAGDLNGDGKPELIISTVENETISVFKNTSLPGVISFADKIEYPSYGTKNIIVRDMDGDGRPDILITSGLFDDTVSVLRNTSINGTISFATKVDLPVTVNAHSLAVVDLDGDSKPDLASCSDIMNAVYTLRNTSTPGVISFAAVQSFATGTKPVRILSGDLDGDGMMDLATANYSSGTISVFRNISTVGMIAFQGKKDLQTGAYPTDLSIGDLNGDGKPDIVVPSNNL